MAAVNISVGRMNSVEDQLHGPALHREVYLAQMTEHADQLEQLRLRNESVNAARHYQLITERRLVRDDESLKRLAAPPFLVCDWRCCADL